MTYVDLQPQHSVGLNATLQHGRQWNMAHRIPLLHLCCGSVAPHIPLNPLKLLECCAVAATAE